MFRTTISQKTCEWLVSISKVRGAFRTLSAPIMEFFFKNRYRLLVVNYFRKKFHHRYPKYTSDGTKIPRSIHLIIL